MVNVTLLNGVGFKNLRRLILYKNSLLRLILLACHPLRVVIFIHSLIQLALLGQVQIPSSRYEAYPFFSFL